MTEGMARSPTFYDYDDLNQGYKTLQDFYRIVTQGWRLTERSEPGEKYNEVFIFSQPKFLP
jgi:hypothetical protein